jgi:hypothetical protein
MKIASTNAELLKKIEGKTLLISAKDLLGSLEKADLFLLSDQEIHSVLKDFSAENRPTVVVYCEEKSEIPSSFQAGLADDLLILPIRSMDMERLKRRHFELCALREIERNTKAIPDLAKRLHDDIHLAEKIQRRLIKEKFPSIGGLSIKSKYWCGLKAGGDYFDIFEFPDGNHVGIIVSDSSTYALSTSFIGSLMQFSIHVGQEELGDPAKIVSALYGKIRENMKEKDRFSIFYGILNRKTYQFRYVNQGPIFAAVKSKSGTVQWLSRGENNPLSLEHKEIADSGEASMEPQDRMMIVSDGWGEALGLSGIEVVEKFLPKEKEPQEIMNSMAFDLRKGVEKLYELEEEEEEFPMPPQDCSVLFFEISKNLLRLARN